LAEGWTQKPAIIRPIRPKNTLKALSARGNPMRSIVNLLFEAAFLKKVPRSGYQFLGVGRESVAEHTFVTTFIGWTLAQAIPDVDAARLLSLCLLHDLPETRMGDLNTVQKKYVTAREKQTLEDLAEMGPVGSHIEALLEEFNQGNSLEARLARDADQLAFLLDLKQLADQGYRSPDKWIPHVRQRIRTEAGQTMAATILEQDSDAWWLKNIIDRKRTKK
jgi:putative hydrolase of HD superfamily